MLTRMLQTCTCKCEIANSDTIGKADCFSLYTLKLRWEINFNSLFFRTLSTFAIMEQLIIVLNIFLPLHFTQNYFLSAFFVLNLPWIFPPKRSMRLIFKWNTVLYFMKRNISNIKVNIHCRNEAITVMLGYV